MIVSFQITDPHEGYSLCIACNKWEQCLTFFHEGQYWTLCRIDWDDYWENTDELQTDYKPPTSHKKETKLRGRLGRRRD